MFTCLTLLCNILTVTMKFVSVIREIQSSQHTTDTEKRARIEARANKCERLSRSSQGESQEERFEHLHFH